jgi:squalene cyclase
MVSDEWVTAYVGCTLASPALAAHPAARAAAEHAFDLLLARRPGPGGWGYNLLVPPDADSTTWVCRLALALGRQMEPRLASAYWFVGSLVTPSGGLATYGHEAVAALAEIEGVDSDFAGWRSPHACVTAAAASLTLENTPAMRDFLGAAQGADGSWQGYWWQDDEYTTALACEAFGSKDAYSAAWAQAAEWAVNRIGDDGAVRPADAVAAKDVVPEDGTGSAFATALALRVLLVGQDGSPAVETAVQRATKWLFGAQGDDGGWTGSAQLRIPVPEATEPQQGPAAHYVDDQDLFTTATVLSALCTSSQRA